MLEVVVAVIALALFFDFLNGFHDAANSIATIVSTRVLSPKLAVAWAAWWNFFAAFTFGVSVANTIARGIVKPEAVTVPVVAAGLLGAVFWNILTWYYGLPISSSHALIGGFVGAGIVKSGFGAIIWEGVEKILLFIVLSPTLGLIAGFAIMVLVIRLSRKSLPSRIDSRFRRMQLVSAAFYSFGHGANDAQKTMGIITALLIASSLYRGTDVPIWVIFAAHAAIALGTLAGGWRIVETMGMRITKLRPIGGFCAETAGAATLIGSSIAGIPVSTTHTIAGAIMGVGATSRLSAVRWGVARRIVWAWVITIPVAAVVSGAAYLLLSIVL